MRLLSVDDQLVDLMAVQQRLLGNYSQLQIDMCGLIDRSEPTEATLPFIHPSGQLLNISLKNKSFQFLPSLRFRASTLRLIIVLWRGCERVNCNELLLCRPCN